MKIDRKKIVNRCGYDQNECMLLAKRLSECTDEALIPELKKISVWSYGKCELGLWADVLDRLDTILERAVTKVGRWMLRLDTPEESSLVDDVVTILEFTGHLIEHSIYRYLYGSWNHILALFGSENMDILLAVLGLSYNFSKRSNYFIRLDPYSKKMVLDRLVSIAETWGGAENNFGLASCCDPNHFPETAGNIYFEYRPDKPEAVNVAADINSSQTTQDSLVSGVSPESRGVSSSALPWNANNKIVMRALHQRKQSPSQIMEEILAQHPIPPSKQMALFARVRLATYFADPEQRHKCIRARLQALSILSYTFDVDERHLYPNLLDELIEVLELPDGQYMGIKACALRTMTAIVNSHRLGVDWASLVGSTGLSSYHGILPNLTRRWIQGLVDGTIEAPGGSTNQQFTTALLSFLYHLACYEENVGPGNTQSATLSSSGVLDTMLQLISWHNSRSDCLSYVTRAVRVTDQILMSISSSRQHVVTILVDRLSYEVDLVLSASTDATAVQDSGPVLTTQRSGLMKSMLNLLKRLCLDTEWSDVMQAAMDGDLPNILRRVFLNGPTHFTPHLALFAMEAITNYLYTYPSRISAMQDKRITTDILKALTKQSLPKNRDFLVQLPGLFNTLALNSRGIEAIQSSGVLTQYLDTLVSPKYLPTMKTKRVRDFLSQISYNPTSGSGQTLSNSLTASQMSNAIQELLRSHNELKPTVFQGLVTCIERVVELGNLEPARLIPESTLLPESALEFLGQTDKFNVPSTSANLGVPNQPATASDDPSHMAAAGIMMQEASTRTRMTGANDERSGVMLDEDVVMLSGGEDEDEDDDNDIDDVTRATQASAAAATRQSRPGSSARLLDSRSTSPTKDGTISVGTKVTMFLPDGTPIPPQMFLPDFMLNTCKFLEKLLPSVLHVTEAMCRHFVSQGGLKVLCDLLRMPGLPYDFPVSAACASLCKIFEDLANSINLNDVIEPLFQCLESSLSRLSALCDSQFQIRSILLTEYMEQQHMYLHELVVTASIICIMVQIIDHLKAELRPVLANKWISRGLLAPLGRLYLGVSWEAGILLKLLSGDKDITDKDIGSASQKYNPDSNIPCQSSSNSKPSQDSDTVPMLASDVGQMPQFVEVLHIYNLLKPSRNSGAIRGDAFLQRYPELIKVTHRILHVTAFLINSVTELCTAWGRFFANRNQVSYRRRRMNLLPSEQIPSVTKYAALSQVSQVLTGILSWEVPITVSSHPASSGLLCAMRYAAVRMTNLLLHDPNNKGPQSGMLNAFFVQGGIQRYFGLFRELINLDLNNPDIREPLTEVLEEWLVCAGRISNTDHILTELRRVSDADGSALDVDKYVESIHQSMLFPLEQLCVRSDLQNLLSRRAVEHLLSMLVGIVPYLFNVSSKQESTKLHDSNTGNLVIGPNADAVSTTETEIVIPDLSSDSAVIDFTHEAGDVAAVSHGSTPPLERISISVNAPHETSRSPTEPLNLPEIIQPDTSAETPIAPEVPTSVSETLTVISPQSADQPQESDRIRDPAAVQLMEEMGFPREIALVALEQTDWNANEAVNLVIATPAEDLLPVAMASSTLGRREGSQASTIRPGAPRYRNLAEPVAGVGGDEPNDWSAPTVVPNISGQSSTYLAFADLATSAADRIAGNLPIDSDLQNLTTQPHLIPQIAVSTTQSDAFQRDCKDPANSSFEVELLPPEKVAALRESLKQNAFRACYAIAKLHHSDQILHRIAELLLSSGEEERYIDQLFGFVATSVSSRLGITTMGTNSPLMGRCTTESVSDRNVNCDPTLVVEPVGEHPTVGLHLSALLFTRCQSLCARLAWEHDLPRLLVTWVSRVDLVPRWPVATNPSKPMDVDKLAVVTEQTIDLDSSRDSTKDYYQTLLLATLILDQYERSVQAMELRKLSVKLYVNAHSWHWFDDLAMLWHPYTAEGNRAIDAAYHKGDLSAYCHIIRRPYSVEFPTMTQMNLDSMHRRPTLLFPVTNGQNAEGSPTEYERFILDGHIPPGLSVEQRKALYLAILNHFETVSKLFNGLLNQQSSEQVLALIPSDCVNAMLRLLLRLAYSSYEDAHQIADANFLSILLNYPHEREFTAEYSAFVGTLLTQVFDDEPTVISVMKDVLHKMSQFGVPSAYMGIAASQVGCRDLFYLLSMCAPLFAKDRKTACQLACETIDLTLSDADVQAKAVPKTHLVEPSVDHPKTEANNITLSPRQKLILTLLIELIVRSPNPTCLTKPRFTQTASCSCVEDVDVQPDNDAYTSMATGAPTVSTGISPASSTTTTTWTSGQTLGHLTNIAIQQRPQQPHTDTSSTSTLINVPSISTSKLTNIVLLGKMDAIRYLIDLIASYRPVAEFVALYKLTQSDMPAGLADRSISFLSHLFTYQLNHSETTELTTSLLENLVLVCSESTQSIIISEFKNSLGRISSPVSSTTVLEDMAAVSTDMMQSQKNECLKAHMVFLERLLSLPAPFVNRLIRIIYKRQIPADIAKLIALVDCNLPNTQSTLSVMLRTLESLTWVERQISKLTHSNHDHGPSSSIEHSELNRTSGTAPVRSNGGLCEDPHSTAEPASNVVTRTSSSSDQHNRSVESSNNAHQQPSGNPSSAAEDHHQPGSRLYESDSDLDDDDDHDGARQQQPQLQRRSSSNDAERAQASTSTATLNLVLEAAADLLRANSTLQTNESRPSWHHGVGTGEQDDSIIFVHEDDEDDQGSAGQGGEAENSQEEDVLDDDDDDEDDDDDDEVEDEEDDVDEDEDHDDEHDDDDDVSGEDEEVAFVLRAGPQQSSGSGRLAPGSRRNNHRRRNDGTTISVSVSGGRVTAELGALQDETDEGERADNDDEEADLVLHDEELDEDDGSFEDDVVDAFERDDDEDMRLQDSTVAGHVFLNSGGQHLRGNNPMVAMVEEVFNLVDVPHHVTATVGGRTVGGRRDRFAFTPAEFSDTGMRHSRAPLGNWGLVFPGIGLVDGLPLRAPPVPPSFDLPPNTAVFRFGLGNGANNGTSLFVTGGNGANRLNSGLNLMASGTRADNSTSSLSQNLPPPTLASQHPLLQIPCVPSTPASQATTVASIYGSSAVTANNARLSRTVVTNTSTAPSTTRMTSALPPMAPQQTSMHYGHRSRAPTSATVPVVIGNSGTRHRGPPTRLYGNTDSFAARAYSPLVESTSISPISTQQINVIRDNRSGPEADALVWNMLTSFAEDQPSSVNSALATAIFSEAETGTRTGDNVPTGSSNSMAMHPTGLTNAQLSSYAGYALPASYRQWITLARMLFGHELMDLVLISRHYVYNELAQRRQQALNRRVKESESAAVSQTAPIEAARSENSNEPSSVPTSDVGVRSELKSHGPTVSSSDAAHTRSEDSESQPNASESVAGPSESPESGENVAMDAASSMPTDTEQQVTTVSNSQIAAPETSCRDSSLTNAPVEASLRPLTDEETIQSLVEGGMDPSFLDALPEDMRREVIADHRHARQLQQRLSAITLPEHINSDWLAGLPPHIQEEVVNQFRQEQQQQQRQQQQQQDQAQETGQSGGPQQRTPENNTAFLLSLPTSLRREVLADMEESQFEMLPPDLAAEARQLRREHEERIARTVQNGVLTHSFSARTDQHLWRNLTSAAGLIGGSGRWDVRFRSINQFLRYLRNTLGGSVNSSGLMGLQTTSSGRGRHLVDHEGLTCLIVLLVASSSCSQQRRHIIPTVKKVLRNLSCHYGTRTWIVGTLLALFDGLSEKSHSERLIGESFVTTTESVHLIPQTSTSDASLTEPNPASAVVQPSPVNTIFNIGFEAALGCWVRVFHPLPDSNEASMDITQLKLGGEQYAGRPPHHHIIHPQAAVSVAGVLLDTLGELARAFPAHFYPRPPEVKGDSSSVVHDGRSPTCSGFDQLRPSFWEIFDRLSVSPPSITYVPSGPGRSGRRSHGSARKRQSSLSKHTNDPSGSIPMEISFTHGSTQASDFSGKPEGTDGNADLTRRRVLSSSSTSNVVLDCFSHLADLLCHPLLHERPLHQERILSILAGIVKEFVIVRGQSGTTIDSSVTRPTAVGENQSVTQSGQPEPSTSTVQPLELVDPNSETAVASTADYTEGLPDLIGPIQTDVIKTLCDCVLAPKSTDAARNTAAQLITDLARANQSTKDYMLKLLCESAGRLATKIGVQLQELINEIDAQHPSDSKGVLTTEAAAGPSTIGSNARCARRTSFDVLPDRFSSSGQVVVISGDSRPAPTTTATAFADLQLKSVQLFSGPNSDQTRFRGTLGLILRIASGDCSLNLTEPISLCAHDPFQSILSLNEFWSRLSNAFERLTTLPDLNAVLLLQPLLEAFCLAHLYLVKDSILLRQRSTISRSSRVNPNASTTFSLMDMVPVLQLRVEVPSVSAADRESQGDSGSSDNTTHLQLDVVGPMSPPYIPMEEERLAGETVHCSRASVSSTSNSNAILQFAEQHRSGLNQILRHHGSGLGESPLAVFLVYPRVLDFDIKRRFFRQQLQSLNNRSSVTSRYDDEPIVISRDRIFEDSYARLHQKSPARWKHKFVIRFQNEEGQDAGGPLREWYLLMSREIFNPNYCLFRTSPADRVTYTINPSSYINSNHLSYFKFVGRFIAKAIYDNKLLECYFSRSFYKHILGVPVKCSDLESDDYEFYKGLEFLLKNHVSDLGYELTFSTEINEFGKTETRDLIENGRNVPVTEHNKREYVRLVCQERMTGAIRQQLDAFLGGFYEIIPKRLISVFNEQELELLISGLPNIDIADLRANSTYSKYQPTSPQIEWFWRALESFDQEDRARFLQFVTGTSKVPLGGFANLEGIHGPTKFQISRAAVSSTNHLPCAHTCFNTLVLPAYETYEQLRARLLTAIRECNEGYGMA